MTTSTFPLIAADVLRGDRFPFQSWAVENRFAYQPAALPLLRRCGSAAEAFYLRPFTAREGFTVHDGIGTAGSVVVTPQAPVGSYRLDLLVTDGTTRLAIEIDGMQFHHRTKEQVAADYLRQRRIVARGYTVIRFTAPEAFRDAAECWRQVDAILASLSRAR